MGGVRSSTHPAERLASDDVAKKYREVRKMLSAAGWKRVRQTGSHETWVSADGARSVTVAGKDSDTVPTGTLGAMRRVTGLDQLR